MDLDAIWLDLAETSISQLTVNISWAIVIAAFGISFGMYLIGFIFMRLASYDAKPGQEFDYSVKTWANQFKAAQKNLLPRGLALHKRGESWMMSAMHCLALSLFLSALAFGVWKLLGSQ